MGLTRFSEIKGLVEGDYPSPIATVFHRYRTADPADLGGRHKLLIDLYEIIIKLVCIVALQEGLHMVKNFVDRLPQRERSLEFLKHPSLGGWVGLLRTLASMENLGDEAPWIWQSGFWHREAFDEDLLSVIPKFQNLGLAFKPSTPRPRAALCEVLVAYRNKFLGHGAHMTRDELQKRLPVLEEAVAKLLASAHALKDLRIVHIDQVSAAQNKRWDISGIELRGLTEEPFRTSSEQQLQLHELYAFAPAVSGTTTQPVPLGPFAILLMNEDTKRRETYFFNDAWRSKLEYLSYQSGTYYYHKELHEEFRSLLKLSLESSEESESISLLPPSERAEHAERELKLGELMLAQGRLEDAVLHLERAAAFERLPETFFRIAQVQRQLGDPVEGIRHTLQRCLDIDPGHLAALAMLQELELESDRDSERPALDMAVSEPTAVPRTIVHGLTPARYREVPWAWWLALMTLYYGASSVAEWFYGESLFVASLAGMYVCTIVFTTGLPMARVLFAWLRLPLSLQLDTMRLPRWNEWFDDRYRRIFGVTLIEHDRFRPLKTLRAEPRYWLLSIGWLLLIQTLIFIGTDSYRLSGPLVIKRAIDYFFVIMWLYPCVRYIFGTTAFIYFYSQLALKPMLTRINDQGMRSLGSLMTFNIALASLAYTAYFFPAAFTHKAAIPSDVAVLLIITLIVSVWSLGMPTMVRRAARRAKGGAIQVYSRHIETAFQAFLRQPAEDTLKSYNWLLAQQKVIQRIPTWPLSLRQTLLLVVGGNLLLIFMCIHYMLTRFSLWSEAAAIIRLGS